MFVLRAQDIWKLPYQSNLTPNYPQFFTVMEDWICCIWLAMTKHLQECSGNLVFHFHIIRRLEWQIKTEIKIKAAESESLRSLNPGSYISHQNLPFWFLRRSFKFYTNLNSKATILLKLFLQADKCCLWPPCVKLVWCLFNKKKLLFAL